jgi:hypothetical protein
MNYNRNHGYYQSWIKLEIIKFNLVKQIAENKPKYCDIMNYLFHWVDGWGVKPGWKDW